MWISRKKLENLEKRIADLEAENQSHQKKYYEMQKLIIEDMSHNIVIKECFNLRLLKYLFEKLNIEEPDTSYKF